MMMSMCPMEEWSQYAGLHPRASFISSIPLPVMYGAMAVYSMRYGVSDTSLLKQPKFKRFVAVMNYIVRDILAEFHDTDSCAP